MKQYKIPKKTVDLLYNTIHEEIMKSRVEISMFLKDEKLAYLVGEIDDIIYKSQVSATEKAIKIFER